LLGVQKSMQPPLPPAARPMAAMPDRSWIDALLTADNVTRESILGERLYPLVLQLNPERAPKLTGMFLQLENAEVINLIESRDALIAKIAEGCEVRDVMDVCSVNVVGVCTASNLFAC
jgi:polyadenylate-binding protein